MPKSFDFGGIFLKIPIVVSSSAFWGNDGHFPSKHFPGGTFFGGHNSNSINPVLTKLGSQVGERQPETTGEFGVTSLHRVDRWLFQQVQVQEL